MSRATILALTITGAALALPACGGNKPPSGESISAARYALRKAEEDGASQAAPVVIRAAQEKLEEASRLRDQKKHEEARQLAEEVALEAQLADAINRNARARARVAELEESAR